MKTLLWTSTSFEGELEFAYNDRGLLINYADRGALSNEQRAWILSNLPRTLAELQELASKSKTIRLVEVKQAVSFEMFWEKYDHKAVSSKKKSLAAWQRMPEAERIQAYNYIARYLQSLPAGVSKKYAETYLNSQLWNN